MMGIALPRDNPTIWFYVNPYTGELLRVPTMSERQKEALVGQGVEHMGGWRPADLQAGWAALAMRRWRYSTIHKSAAIMRGKIPDSNEGLNK